MLSGYAVKRPKTPGKAPKTVENTPRPGRYPIYHAMHHIVSTHDIMRFRYGVYTGMLWGGGIFMGEGYIRRIPLPDFPSQTHGLPYPSIQNARVRPVRGGRSPVSALGSINTLPGPKWALNRSKTALSAICGISALREAQDVVVNQTAVAFPHRDSRFSPPPVPLAPLPTSLAGGLASITGAIWGGFGAK